MLKWKYQLDKEGKALRRAIEDGSGLDVIRELLNCYRKIEEVTGDTENPWIADSIEDLEIWADYPEVDADTVDGFLDSFYDVCDDLRVWVGI